jgi:hypothetical protein
MSAVHPIVRRQNGIAVASRDPVPERKWPWRRNERLACAAIVRNKDSEEWPRPKGNSLP